MRRIFSIITVAIILAAVAVEGATRWLGLVDFPLYDANAQIGYIPAASQRGTFMNKNAWEFNEHHMNAGPFRPSDRGNVLLVGDSIVLGGNPLAQSDRLGPQLAAKLGGPAVWPIAAGSWTLRNELEWIRENDDVVAKMDRVVLVLNSGDFTGESSWSCEVTHPRSKPISATVYLFMKYINKLGTCGVTPPELRMPPGDLSTELTAYAKRYGDKTIVMLYPDINEFADGVLREKHFAAGISILKSAGVTRLVQLSADSRWNRAYYRDGIHPSASGNALMADVLASSLRN